MTRYQIKVPGGHLTDLVHELATQSISHAVVTAGVIEPNAKIHAAKLYPAVFRAARDVLKKYVKGFHVCGCRPHCDNESEPTELARPGGARPRVMAKAPPLSRYVLSLEVPLKEFAKELETELIRAIAGLSAVKNWRKLLLPTIRDAVEPTLGRYLSYSPSCNRGEYLCTVGACTEFDPWEEIAPKA
jgi:hypothetical protein